MFRYFGFVWACLSMSLTCWNIFHIKHWNLYGCCLAAVLCQSSWIVFQAVKISESVWSSTASSGCIILSSLIIFLYTLWLDVTVFGDVAASWPGQSKVCVMAPSTAAKLLFSLTEKEPGMLQLYTVGVGISSACSISLFYQLVIQALMLMLSAAWPHYFSFTYSFI